MLQQKTIKKGNNKFCRCWSEAVRTVSRRNRSGQKYVACTNKNLISHLICFTQSMILLFNLLHPVLFACKFGIQLWIILLYCCTFILILFKWSEAKDWSWKGVSMSSCKNSYQGCWFPFLLGSLRCARFATNGKNWLEWLVDVQSLFFSLLICNTAVESNIIFGSHPTSLVIAKHYIFVNLSEPNGILAR